MEFYSRGEIKEVERAEIERTIEANRWFKKKNINRSPVEKCAKQKGGLDLIVNFLS